MMNKSAISLYLKQVKKELCCSTKQKRMLLSSLSESLQDYAQGEEFIPMEQLIEVYGRPQAQAEELMETLDMSDIKKAFSWKHIILIGVIIALLIWGIIGVMALVDGHHSVNGYTVVELEDERIDDNVIEGVVT